MNAEQLRDPELGSPTTWSVLADRLEAHQIHAISVDPESEPVIGLTRPEPDELVAFLRARELATRSRSGTHESTHTTSKAVEASSAPENKDDHATWKRSATCCSRSPIPYRLHSSRL